MRLDVSGLAVTVRGDEYTREVRTIDDLDGIAWTRLRALYGASEHLLRADGSFDRPVAVASVPRVGVAAALDRFARQPIGTGGGTTAPPSFDGMYRVTGVRPSLTGSGDQLLLPAYDVSLADGRTLTLLAIGDESVRR